MTRKTLVAAVLAAGSLMGIASSAQAVPAVVATEPAGETVIVQSAPPAPIYEAVPAPRAGFVWAPGHYEWRHGHYAWMAGEWLPARAGYAWRAGHWEQRGDGSWMFVAGRWMRGDDVAFNEGRRGPFGDRDGDGVINRDDRYPRDPSRY
jgi:hypothetical protein